MRVKHTPWSQVHSGKQGLIDDSIFDDSFYLLLFFDCVSVQLCLHRFCSFLRTWRYWLERRWSSCVDFLELSQSAAVGLNSGSRWVSVCFLGRFCHRAGHLTRSSVCCPQIQEGVGGISIVTDDVSSQLTISSGQQEHCGCYTIELKNSYGLRQAALNLTIVGKGWSMTMGGASQVDTI